MKYYFGILILIAQALAYSIPSSGGKTIFQTAVEQKDSAYSWGSNSQNSGGIKWAPVKQQQQQYQFNEVKTQQSYAPKPAPRPIQAPVQQSYAQKPVQAPVQQSYAHKLAPRPVQAPMQQSYAPKPVQAPIQTPVQQSYAPKPASRPMQAPMQQSYAPKPVQQTYSQSSYSQQRNGYSQNTQVSNDFSSFSVCSGAEINDRFPHPNNPNKFIQCGFDGASFERDCPPRTFFETSIGQCTLGFDLVTPCARVEHACKNGGICENVDDTQYMCECKRGFAGDDCSVNIDDCASQPCGVDECVDLIDGFVCVKYNADGTTLLGSSPSSYYPSQCQVTEEPDQFFSITFNPGFYYQCTPSGIPIPKSCHAGLFWHLSSRVCLDYPPNPACEELNCNGNEMCVEQNGQLQCACRPGRTGAYCEQEIDLCQNNPCRNNGICTSYGTGFNCECPNKFYHNDCAETNVQNPCSIEQMNKGYHIHAYENDNTKFISCYPDGFASILSCQPGMFFDPTIRTCLSQEYVQALNQVQNAVQQSDWVMTQDPLRQPDKSSAILVPYDETKSERYQQSLIYNQPTSFMSSSSYSVQVPLQQSYAPKPVQAPVQQSYAPKPAPRPLQAPVQQSYVPKPAPRPIQAPMQQSYAPKPIQAPMQQSYVPKPAPQKNQAPIQQSYAPKPIQAPVQQSYAPKPAPRPVQAPMQKSYSGPTMFNSVNQGSSFGAPGYAQVVEKSINY